jgi:hypothetical protein
MRIGLKTNISYRIRGALGGQCRGTLLPYALLSSPLYMIYCTYHKNKEYDELLTKYEG